MALTRKMLAEWGITDEDTQEKIIKGHTDTISGIREDHKTELEEAKKTAKDGIEYEWKTKYEKEHTDFENFKTTQAKAAAKAKKGTAYKSILKEIGIDEKHHDLILRASELDGFELSENGDFSDKKAVRAYITKEYGTYVPTVEKVGAKTENPLVSKPAKMTKDEIYKMENGRFVYSASERQAFIEANEE